MTIGSLKKKVEELIEKHGEETPLKVDTTISTGAGSIRVLGEASVEFEAITTATGRRALKVRAY